MERGRGRHRRAGRRPYRGRGSGGDREYVHRDYRGPARDHTAPPEVRDAAEKPQETADDERSHPVFSRRKVLSNWDRYEAAEKAAEGEEEVLQRGTDYHVLLSSAGDSFSQFRLAEEKDWGGGESLGSVCLDGAALVRALQALPRHLRLNVGEEDGVQEELPQELPHVRRATPLGGNHPSLGANVTPLGANHPSLGANPSWLGATHPSLGANPSSLGATHPSLGANPSSLGANATPLGISHPSLGANPSSLGANLPPQGVNPAPRPTPDPLPLGLYEELDFLLSLGAPAEQRTEAPDQPMRVEEPPTSPTTTEVACKAAEKEKAKAVTAEDLEDWLDSMIA